MSDSPEAGYVNYFTILGVTETAKPGDVRKEYRNRMKALIGEIQGATITPQRRAHYTLEMAKLNAALVLLRDPEKREGYAAERGDLIALEQQWRAAVEAGKDGADKLRREFDRRLREFLSRYVEELMLEAGRDKECVEASGWNPGQERHATRILRHYRHLQYREILRRLPFTDVTKPSIDWDERAKAVADLIAARGN